MKPRELAPYVQKLAASYGLVIDFSAAQELVDRVGDSTTMLDAQVKTLAALSNGQPITTSFVEQHIARVAEVAMAYSGDLSSPKENLYTLDYYLKLAEQIVESGAHILAIKDMAGLLRPEAASKLVMALRKEFDLPVHVHTHDTAGGQMATYYAAALSGADIVDGASAPLAGTTSQPSLSALIAAFSQSKRDTGIDLQAVSDLEPYWEAVRQLYAPFENGIPGPTGRVYKHEIPGGQLSNLRAQAAALGLADRFEVIEDTYAAVNEMLGRPTRKGCPDP